MINDSDIRSEIGRFLAGEITLDQFENWLVPRSWNVHQWGSVETQQLAYAIELGLAEHEIGHLSDEDLRKELHQLANTYLLTSRVLVTSAGSTSVTGDQWQLSPAGNQLSTASSLPIPR